jgi:hypothetical protein
MTIHLGRFTFWVLLFLLGCQDFLAAQVTEHSSAAAYIINPVSIPRNVNSEFGNVAVIVSGTIELAPAVAGHPGISLPVTTGTFTAAAFYFAGPEGYGINISTPPKPLIVNENKHPFLVSSFVSNPIQNQLNGMINGVFISVSPSKVTVNYN